MNKNQPVPAHDEVQAVIRNLRCIAKTVLSSEARSSMRADLESAIRLLATLPAQTEQQPVGYQFQDREGVWKQFMDERHYEDTLADGTWPIRAIYAAPIAQTAPQPEQSNFMALVAKLVAEVDKPLLSLGRWSDVRALAKQVHAALSAQGESHE